MMDKVKITTDLSFMYYKTRLKGTVFGLLHEQLNQEVSSMI